MEKPKMEKLEEGKKYELPEENIKELAENDKAEVDAALKVLENLQASGRNDEEAKLEARKWLKAVQNKGRRVLPYLASKLQDKKMASQAAAISSIINGLAEEEDSLLLAKSLKNENVLCSKDNSFRLISSALLNNMYRIKNNDETDKRLNYTAREIKSLLNIIKNSETEDHELHNQFFGTKDDIRLTNGKKEKLLEILSLLKVDQAGAHFSKDNTDQYIMHERVTDAIKLAGKVEDLPKTIKGLAGLMIFNDLSSLSREENTKRGEAALGRIKRLKQREQEMESLDEVPTIGVEVECLGKFIDQNRKDILNRLSIKNYKVTGRYNILHEVAPDYSYSALAQSRYLQELMEMGAIPPDFNDKGKRKTKDKFIYSLHVNFGIPPEVNRILEQGAPEGKFKDDIYGLYDAATFAFASPERVTSANIRDEVVLHSRYVSASKKNIDNLSDRDDKPKRLEYRANEFRDFSAYRMLSETQKLAAALFAFIKLKNGSRINEREEQLADIWQDYTENYKKIKEKYKINQDDLYDKDPKELARLIKDTGIKKECRQLITLYSKRVGGVLRVDNLDNIT